MLGRCFAESPRVEARLTATAAQAAATPAAADHRAGLLALAPRVRNVGDKTFAVLPPSSRRALKAADAGPQLKRLRAIRRPQDSPVPPRLFFTNGLQDSDMSVLQLLAVGPETVAEYTSRILLVETALARHRGRLSTIQEIDLFICDSMNTSRLLGYPYDQATKTLAALQWRHPELGRYGSEKLPLTRQSLQGFNKTAPVAQREPLSWAEACGIAADLVRRKLWDFAVGLVIMFDLYLRPGEMTDIHVGDLTPPHWAGGASTRNWVLTVRPMSRGRPAKTGAFDDSVVFDHPERQYLANSLRFLTQNRARQDLLLPNVTPGAFAKEFARSCKNLGIQAVPYQARHGGPSEDRAAQLRSLFEVMKRGRWLSESSVRRYEKHGKLGRRLHRLPVRTQRHLADCTANIKRILALDFMPALP